MEKITFQGDSRSLGNHTTELQWQKKNIDDNGINNKNRDNDNKATPIRIRPRVFVVGTNQTGTTFDTFTAEQYRVQSQS